MVLEPDADQKIHAAVREAFDKFAADLRATEDATRKAFEDAVAALKAFEDAVAALQEPVSICGWCPGARELTRELAQHGRVVSHGMCPACAEKFKEGK